VALSSSFSDGYVDSVSGGSSGKGSLGTGRQTQREIRLPKRGTFTSSRITPETVSINKVSEELNAMAASTDPRQIKQWLDLNKLAKAGGFGNMQEALASASMDPNKGERSWQQYLADRADTFKSLGITFGGGSGGGSGGPFSSTQTVTNVSSPSQSEALADNAYQSNMGRMVRGGEAQQFRQGLNMMERQNPTVSKTSGFADGKGNTTSKTETTGGWDPTTFARDWVRSQEGYTESFAASTFMNLLDRVISQPNKIEDMIAEAG